MSDVDVKVGIQVTGDPSGAQQVDDAIKQVGDTSKQVAKETGDAAAKSAEAASQAAQKASAESKSVADVSSEEIKKLREELEQLKQKLETPPSGGGIKDGVDGVSEALKKLSPEKAKGSVSGLTQAILGLVEGDTTKGLEGLARGLSSIAFSLPLPGVAVAVGAAVAGIVGAWKLLRDDTGETERELNSFGETIDEEMTRLESWADSQFEFSNLKAAIGDIKSEFDSATKTTATFTNAVLAAIDARYAGEAGGLRQQAASARAGGDDVAAKAFEEEAARRELISKITQEKVELESLVDQYEFQREKIKMQEQSLADLIAKEKEVVASFDSLKSASEKWSGNADAALGGEARDRLVATLEKEIAVREKSMKVVEIVDSQRHPAAGRIKDDDFLVGYGEVGKIKDLFSEVPSLRELIDNLKLAEQQLSSYDDAVKNQKTNYDDSRKAILEEGRSLAELNAQRIKAAQDYAAAISGIDAGVVSEAVSVAESMNNLAERSAAATEAAAQAGVGMVDVVESFGAAIGTTSGEQAKEIEKGGDQIKEAIEGTAAEVGAAGDEITNASVEARTKFGGAAEDFKAAATDLSITARAVGQMGKDLASSQHVISQEVAQIWAQISSLKSDVSLAKSQIRNSQ